MTSGIWILIIGLLVVIAVIAWIAYLATGLTLIFTAFVMRLPAVLSILMFIIFPPTLIVFLMGYAILEFGRTKNHNSD